MKFEGKGEAEVLETVNSRSKDGNFVYSTFGWHQQRIIEGAQPFEAGRRSSCPMLKATRPSHVPASCPMTRLVSHTTRPDISSTCPVIQ